MAYNRAARAAKEARFRAEHGMSSGAWYEMRRKAKAAGISPTDFDKARGRKGVYTAVKNAVRAKRSALTLKRRGYGAARMIIQDFIDQLPPDIEMTWGTP